MKLTERLSPGVARGVIFARPGSLHPVFTSVVVGTASARRVARSTLLQVASSSSRPTPSIRSLRPAQHPASACFGPPSILPHLASARPAVNAVCVVRNAMRKRDCVSHAKGLFWKSRVHRRESMLRLRRRRHCRRRQHCRCAPRRAVNDEPT